jgi:bla regulator protein blaR1
MPRSVSAAAAPVLLLAAILQAQTFDVASIKRSAPANPNGSTFEFLQGGGLRVEYGTLRGLIESAYDVRDYQITGGPSWLNVDRYDVTARSEPGSAEVSRAEEMAATRLKLRALLAERFQLAVHRETRESQEYALDVEKSGSKVITAESVLPNARTGIQSTCGRMTGTQASMANLVFVLSRQLRRPVIDRTGLKDRYNFELNWTPDVAPCIGAADNNAPSIFTALREQLGLRLDSIKGPVETIVVDRAERPSED